MTAPASTYRLQLHPGFGFDDAVVVTGYLSRLGVSHAYLSPVLQAAPGSTHGYDVVDHSSLSEQAGGREGFDRLVAALNDHGMAAIADLVPNHMCVPTPARLNTALWSVLRDGPGSPYGGWFDVEWAGQPLLLPVLGRRIGQVLADDELTLDRAGEEPVLRYYEHEFPVRPGTADLPLPELVDRQWYRLAHWRVATEELNYRRFFDIDTLAAIRMEDPEVFEAAHRLLLGLYRDGKLTGLRIDHPDGLADPREYLRRLADRTGGGWVVVEKILEGDEVLPADWPCAGTTGYDALLRIGGLFVDPAGAAPLGTLLAELTGESTDFQAVVEQAKRELVQHGLYAEVHRLVDLLVEICHADVMLRDHTRRGLEEVLIELLIAFGRYRAYVVPGEPASDEAVGTVRTAAEVARRRLTEDRHDTLDLLVDLVLDRPAGSSSLHDQRARRELVVRFQQTCGPVMAKGVEDTAFYRWFRLASLNEVGGDPDRFGITPEEFHRWAERIEHDWPDTMTTLSTHDTKRSEDVRARLAVLSEIPAEWSATVRSWRALAADHRDRIVDPQTEYLVWQTLVGTWPIGPDRLLEYLLKAVREAKLRTSWTSPDEHYEQAVERFARGVLDDPAITEAVSRFVADHAASTRAVVLGQKLVQLTMPGVPDTYQGTEIVDLSLVDPDNRRQVDFAARAARLDRLDAGERPEDLNDEKLLVTSRALRLRRDRPAAFTGYSVLPATSGHTVAFARGTIDDPAAPAVITVATRLAVTLERYGGWGDDTVALPPGEWADVLTGRPGVERVRDLLADLPVALLKRG
jgi:(1->4)-alpha-D-glucan 1-alpha-D-glucosylmutase